MRFGNFLICLLAIGFMSQVGIAQGKNSSKKKKDSGETKSEEPREPSPADITFYAPRKMSMKFGLHFEALDNNCTAIHATLPIPTDWPEQKIEVTAQQITQGATYEMRKVQGGALQMVIDAPGIQAGGSFDAILTVDVTKSFIKAPESTSSLVIPKKLSKDLNWYMGSSPYIDPKDGAIKKIVKETKEAHADSPWEFVEALHDWVRENIEYRNGNLRSTKEAMKDRKGDCEEMTGIFVAMCRAANIPARCVWIPEHCYAEFYLEEEDGTGHWYPCQLAGDKQFGQMSEYRPILQKGDRFQVPEHSQKQRYLAEFFTCQRKAVTGNREPTIKQIRDLGPLQQEIDALKKSDPRLGSNDSEEQK